ncbi:MAG: malto-oligosyltrehalose synthase [Burkholderiaceae bacterium]
MTALSRLRQLAELKGIAASYEDVWGEAHEVTDATLAALLVVMAALDAADTSPAAIDRAIAAHELERRAEILPPVCLLFDDEAAWRLPLQAPGAAPRGTQPSESLSWRIELEDGSVQQGDVAPDLAAGQRPPLGYHTLSIQCNGQTLARCTLIVAPRTGYTPPALQSGAKVWGAAAQLYALRSQRNWGIGDYTDLAMLIDLWGQAGAGVVGVSPLHAMFPHNPAHASPYSPSSRLFLNVQYLDVEAIPDFAECAGARAWFAAAANQARLEALRRADLVDHVGVAQAKREVLEQLYAHFQLEHLALGTARAGEFEQFRRQRGAALRRHALFEALQAHFHGEDPQVWGWPVWPQAYRDPDSPQVAEFERERIEAVQFYEYLQWQADAQLAAVAQRWRRLGKGTGLSVGLYVDLAVSIDRAGAQAWSEQTLYVLGASVGAPPDEYNPKGQNWGLPPIDPTRLRAAGYAPFVATLRANMRHAGALRIDHVMALMRLYWIAPGADASQGAYVHYPFDELLAIVTLESRRNRCLVIGEDLGTVPDEVRSKLGAAGVLSYRVLDFERDGVGNFMAPADYEAQAIAVASTHDLATLAGWWEGRDLALRQRLNLFPRPEDHAQQAQERARDRKRLLLALQSQQLLPPGTGTDPAALPALDAAGANAVHAYLARGPAQIVVAQLEDVLLATDQVNLPGTTDQYPNWRRKLNLPLERWADDARFVDLTRTFARERPARAGAPLAAIPRSTYRMQLHLDFNFENARALVPYLAELGISHLYCSPPLRARPGSQHGYDVVDHGALNPELGTRQDFDRLVESLHQHDMGLLVDIVPNHMGVLSGDNAWWLDVLENGAASVYAEFFDIDWAAADPALTGRVLLPILGDQYGVVLERGELVFGFDAARGYFTLSYHEHRLPVDPAGYGALLRRALRGLSATALPASGAASVIRLAEAFERLPPHSSTDPAARTLRQRDKTLLKARLAEQVHEFSALGAGIESIIGSMNGVVGERASFDALDALIDAQPYRLAQWRVAGDEINYRRFFDINELAALRMERAEVFEATHQLILELAASGAIDGLRIDHPDGLADPASYFRRLQRRYTELAGLPTPEAAGAQDPPHMPLYVVVEKIVAPHEQVPRDWAVHGTTGYRFANLINGLMIDASAKTRLDRVWRAFVRDEAEDFDTLAWHCRHLVMDGTLAGELTVLSARLLRLAREDRRTRDFTLNSLRQALAEVVASFPVYRTYIVDKPSAQDRRFIDWAIGRARRRSLAADSSVFDFLRRVLLGGPLPGASAGLGERYRQFVQRLQQYTAPVAAKGIEDTAFYRHQRLISVNDVGGDPDAFGTSVAAFHAENRERAQNWPYSMLASSTHDAKRSEDTRARIDVISEMPAAWRLAVRRWSRMNRSHRRIVDGSSAPTRNDEYQLYQRLVGSFPVGPLDAQALAVYAGRVEQATLKAARESKVVTSWMNPHQAYENALVGFVQALLTPRESNLFLGDLQINAAVFARHGALNGITMATLKTLSPGVPDFYQGCEAIELTLVDPDNRRAVDFERRRTVLAGFREIAARPERADALREMLAQAVDGRAKFWATWRALQLRQQHEALLRRADYLALEVRGERAANLIAFARSDGRQSIVVVAARLYASLGLEAGGAPVGAVWGDTHIVWPQGITAQPSSQAASLECAISGQRHAFAGTSVSAAQLLRDFPVAALSVQGAGKDRQDPS